MHGHAWCEMHAREIMSDAWACMVLEDLRVGGWASSYLHVDGALRLHGLVEPAAVGAVGAVKLLTVVRADDLARRVVVGGVGPVELLQHWQDWWGSRLQVMDHRQHPSVRRGRAMVRVVDGTALGPMLDEIRKHPDLHKKQDASHGQVQVTCFSVP